jgi:hypothetical protein
MSSSDDFNGERPFGEQMKAKFAGLDAFIPPARPLELIDGAARVDREESRRSTERSQRVATVRFRGNVGAPLALVGLAAVLVVTLGVGILGPRSGIGAAQSSSPAAESPSSPADSPAAASPTRASDAPTAAASSSAAQSEAAAPARIFSKLGGAASWSTGGSYIAYIPSGTYKGPSDMRIAIFDTSGRAVDTVAATSLIWVGDDTYLGFSASSNGYANAFVGRVGSAAQQPIAGSFVLGPSTVASQGVAILSVDQKDTKYVVWTPAGLSVTRSGDPVAISADGGLLAVDHYPPLDSTQPQQSRLDIVRTDDGSVVASYPESYGVFGFSPDGSKVAFGPGYTRGDTRFFIMDVTSGRVSVADSCATQHGKWLDNSHMVVYSPTSCSQAAGSGVTIETMPDSSIAVSAEGDVASAGGTGVPGDAVVNIRLTIQKRTGERETVDYQGSYQNLRLDWSPDGSLLLLQYSGPGSSNPPSYVVLLRP